MAATPLVMAWSGGKDSAMALWRLQQAGEYEVRGLLTTVTAPFKRISMHGVRSALLEAQAAALGLDLHPVEVPAQASNDTYESAIGAVLERLKSEGIQAVGFGDLFLADIRAYRERMLAGSGLSPVFPLWRAPTAPLAREMIAAGFRATLCCVDPKALDPAFAGREFDRALLDELPAGVDACGENGEFHTFVHDAPNFSAPISIAHGDTVERDGFWFHDLLPAPI